MGVGRPRTRREHLFHFTQQQLRWRRTGWVGIILHPRAAKIAPDRREEPGLQLGAERGVLVL